MKKWIIAFLIAANILVQVLHGATENVRVETKTHAVQKPQASATALYDLDFTGLTIGGIPSSGGGGPGGSDAQFQFNNSFAFGGVPYTTYNGTTVTQVGGVRYTLIDGVDTSKKVQLNIAVPTGTTKTVSIFGDSVTVVPSTAASNFFVTGVSNVTGQLQTAQPTFTGISGLFTLAQSPSTTASKLIGRGDSGAGSFQEITLGSNLAMSGTTLNATGGTGSPGGSDTQMQWNDSGAFGGISTWTVSGGGTLVNALSTSFTLADAGDPTKKINFGLSNISTGTTRTVTAGAGTNLVIPGADAGTTNNFLTGITTAGLITKAQPSFANLSGTITLAQNSLPIGKELYVDGTNGNDGTGTRGNLARPYLTISAALAAASAGDVVYVGPGTYTQGTTALVVPGGVSLIGAGADYTIISSSTTVASNRASVEPGTSSIVRGVTISNAASAGVPYGALSSSAAFTSAYLTDSKLTGVSDGIRIARTGATGLHVDTVSISTQGDCFASFVSGGIYDLRNCELTSDGTATASSKGINATGGTTRFYSGTITTGNSATTNIGALSSGSGTTVELHSVRILNSATGVVNYDVQQASSGTFSVENATRSDGAALVTSGTITQLSRYAYRDNNLSDLPSAATARTNLGLAIGTNVEAWDTQLDSVASLAYTGNSLKVIRVNAGETGFELATESGTGGTPGGVDTQVQFNNAGSFNGIPYLTYDGSSVTQKTGTRFTLADSTDASKKVQLDLSAIAGSTTRTVAVAPSANSTTVVPSSAVANQFLTGLGTGGTVTRAQPAFSDLSGSLALSQTSIATNRLLGRSTAGTGAVEEITPGAGLSLSGGTLSVTITGSPGGSDTQVQYNNAGGFNGIAYSTFDGTALNQQAGTHYRLQDATDQTKQLAFNLASINTGTTRTFTAPNADFTGVVPDTGAANQFLTGIGSGGVITKAQPTFTNLSGTATNAQLPTTISSKTLDDSNTVTVRDGLFTLENSTTTTKRAIFDLSNISSSTTRTINVPNANSTTIQADTGAANNFLTAVSAQGAISKAQPDFTNLSGSISLSQNNLPIARSLFVDGTNGNDATGARGNLAKPYLTIAVAITAASPGDVVYVQPGTFNQGSTPLVIKAGVSLVGSGTDITYITGNTALSTNRALVEPGTGSSVYGVTIQTTATTGAAYGVGSSSTAFTSAYMAGCKVVGISNGVWVAKTGSTGLRMEDVVIQVNGSAITQTTSGATMDVVRSDITSDATGGGNAKAIDLSAATDNGTVNVRDSNLAAINSPGTNVIADAATSGSKIELINVRLNRNSTGTTNLDLRQATSATVSVDNVSRIDAAGLTTSGTITQLSRNLIKDLNLSDLTNAATARTNLGLAIGTNVQAEDPQLDSVAALTYTGNANKVIRVNAGETGFELAAGAGGGPGGSNTQVQFNDSGVLGGDSAFTWDKTNDILNITQAPAANTVSDGLQLYDLTPATSGNQQYSPSIHFQGQGWKTNSVAGSQPVEFRLELVPTQGTANPGGYMSLISKVNSGSENNVARFYAGGGLTVGGSTNPGGGKVNAEIGYRIAGTDLPFSGGTSGQVLTKNSNTNYDWVWTTVGGSPFDPSVDSLFTAPQTITVEDTVVDDSTPGLTLVHNTTGTPANFLGAEINFAAETSTTLGQIQGSIDTGWADVTHATRKAVLDFRVFDVADGNFIRSRIFSTGSMNVGVASGGSDPGAGIINANTGFKAGGTEFPVDTNGIVKRTAANTYSAVNAPSGTIVGTTDAQTITNKRINKRTGTTTSSATPSIDTNSVDVYYITAQAVAITSMSQNLTGNPSEAESLLIWIKDNGSAQTISWGASFTASSDLPLPTTTTAGKYLYCSFIWNSVLQKWILTGKLDNIS